MNVSWTRKKENSVSEFKNTSGEAAQKEPAMWAKVGDGWSAIPPSMADSFRKAGAEVRHELLQ
jgi:hypothetical protein